MELSIDTSELQRLGAALSGTGPLLDAELQTAGTRSTLQIQREIQEAAPVWQGTARRSVTTQAAPRQWKVGTNVVHAIVQLETGRAVGAPMPPAGSLLPWMSSKGIDAALEFVIRRKIGRDGIPARRLFSTALQRNEGAIRAEFDAAIRRFTAKIGARL